MQRRAFVRRGLSLIAPCMLGLPVLAQTPVPVHKRIVLLVDEIKAIRSFPVVLAERLGYFRDQGMDVAVMNIRDDVFHDKLLADGRIDAVMAYHHHNIVNHSKGMPSQSIVSLGITPGMRLLVAPHARERMRTAADLKGARIITGGNNSSKTTVTNYLVRRAGFTFADYTRLPAYANEKAAAMLKDGEADLIMAPNPDDDYFLSRGLAFEFINLITPEDTRRHLGEVYPSNTIFMTTARIEQNPEIAQHLANAFVRTLKYINGRSAEELAAVIPPEIRGKYASAYVKTLGEQMPMYAGNGLMSAKGAEGETQVFADFNPAYRGVKAEATYTNRFASEALARYANG